MVKKFEVDRSEWQTSPGPVGTERGIEGGQQCTSETRRIRARRGRDHAGLSGEEEVQELGGDAELHELGYMDEDGESDTRELEESDEGSLISARSRKSDVGDASMETRRAED